MGDSLSRRRLARIGFAAPAAMVLRRPLRTGAPAAEPREDLLDQARRNLTRNREVLAKFPLEMTVEPAFRFSA